MARKNLPIRLPLPLLQLIAEEKEYISARNQGLHVTTTYVVEKLLEEALKARHRSRANTDLTFVTRNLRHDN